MRKKMMTVYANKVPKRDLGSGTVPELRFTMIHCEYNCPSFIRFSEGREGGYGIPGHRARSNE